MIFIDESGFMLQPLLRRTWAPKGETPVLANWNRHDRITAIGALTLTPHRRRLGLYFHLLDHNARYDDFFWFLADLHDEVGRDMIVIWDRLSAHRKCERILRELDCSWAQFEYLPAYCPELNPVEHVWNTSKWGNLANWAPADKRELLNGVNNSLKQQATDQQLLRSHFHWAGLSLQ